MIFTLNNGETRRIGPYIYTSYIYLFIFTLEIQKNFGTSHKGIKSSFNLMHATFQYPGIPEKIFLPHIGRWGFLGLLALLRRAEFKQSQSLDGTSSIDKITFNCFLQLQINRSRSVLPHYFLFIYVQAIEIGLLG